MFLIVGLGNPGNIYKKTRHNAGFMAVDFISNRHNFIWSNKSKFNADITSGSIGDYKLVLCKPNSFMNLSGRAVLSIMSYYKIESKKLIVIHDDIDIDFANIKCKIGGSSGGHKGLKSIDEVIDSNYYRIRLGVGRPDYNRENVADYVLSNFSDSELNILDNNCKNIAENINFLFSSGLEEFKKQIAKNG